MKMLRKEEPHVVIIGGGFGGLAAARRLKRARVRVISLWGMLKDVTYIQRVNTKGGVAPAEACNASIKGTKKTVPYAADYVFYKAG